MRRVALLLVLSIAACGDADGATPPDVPSEPETTATSGPARTSPITEALESPVDATDSPYPAGRVDPGLVGLVDVAIADLAARLGVDAAAITPVSAELVTWPDGSAGCPQPGVEYLQVPQEGSLIELGHGGLVYRYHSGGSRTTPFLCDQASTKPPAPGG